MIRRVVVDASALAAVIFGEAEGEAVAPRLEGAPTFAPALLKFEMANVAWKKVRREPGKAAKILTSLNSALANANIIWREVDHADVVLISQTIGVSTYDASYLWLAGALGADLVTLDKPLARASAVLTV